MAIAFAPSNSRGRRGLTAFGATPPLARASAKDGRPCFADLHHHDLRPGEPPEGQLDGGEGNEGGQGFGPRAPTSPQMLLSKALIPGHVITSYSKTGSVSSSSIIATLIVGSSLCSKASKAV